MASGEPNFYAYVSDSNSWVDVFGLSGFFTPSTFQAPSVSSGGTGNNYKVFQQDIDWNATFNKKGGGIETNLDKALRGDAPLVNKNGNWEVINLHHSRQQGKGPLFELSQSTHLYSNNSNGRKALHPFSPNKNPLDPVGDRNIFDVDREAYWKERASKVKGCG
ncbi:Rhs family protein [Cellulophaga geojensis KL-A]|uniref:Rhs family protein n=1 Tax=Cellulophaga geojensis KL-A TaxID=1328323 RepID=A0ABN0RK31_9FLAO|nr:Rhs family protein [Cellulophaga geojensis KL-A]